MTYVSEEPAPDSDSNVPAFGLVEESWREKREAVLRVLDVLGQGVTLLNEHGLFEYVNPAYARLVGLTPEEIVGRSPFEFTVPDDIQILLRAQGQRTRGAMSSYEFRTLRADGTHVPVLATGVPRYDQGRFIGSFSVVTSLTAQRRAEEALVAAGEPVPTGDTREFFCSLAKQAAGATGADYAMIGELLPGGQRVRTLAWWTLDRISDNWEYDCEGTPCLEVIQGRPTLHPSGVCERFPNDKPLREAQIEAYCGAPLVGGNGQVLGLISLMRRKEFADGELAVATSRIFAVRAAAELERHRAVEELLQSRKLEGLGRLAGGIAHDFNNVLTAIIGSTHLAFDALPANSPARAHLDQIKSATDRAAGMTRQLLAFARRQVPQLRVVNLTALLQETEQFLRPLIGEHIAIENHIEPLLWPARIDPVQIQQVLLNLAVNARDAMSQGGTLTIDARNVVLEDDGGQADWVLITVHDTGAGMSPEVQKHAFEPFYTTKEVGRGTGLGLASAFGIVTQCGGRIGLESSEDEGTSVQICLPRAFGEPEVTLEPSWVEERGAGTILLVEDDELVREPLAHSLRSRGYEVLTACDGQQALALCEASGVRIDLLVTDVVMPALGGVELNEALRLRDPNLRTLFISGYTESSTVGDWLETGRVEFLFKPFSPGQLATRVRLLLAGRQTLTETY